MNKSPRPNPANVSQPIPEVHELSKNVAKTSKLNLKPNMQLPSSARTTSLAYPDPRVDSGEDTCHVACQVAIFRGHFEAN